MKIKIKRVFRYQVSATKVREIQPGVYDVPGRVSLELAQMVLRFGKAEILAESAPPKVVEKVAPENKVVEVTANKARVAKTPMRRRSSRSKSDK